MRLFVAVALPGAVVQQLAGLPRPEHPRLRWTRPDQWHVTLRFLGPVPAPAVVAEALGSLPGLFGGRPVHAELGPAAAWFPGRRVLQVPVGGLDELAAAVDGLVGSFGRPLEHPFAGHLTLARSRGRPAPRRIDPDLGESSLGVRWDVTEVHVFASHPAGARPGSPGGTGVRYEVLQTVDLATGPRRTHVR